MKIGYLSDGDAEISTLPTLLNKTGSPNAIVGIVKTHLQIDTLDGNIIAASEKGMRQLRALGADAVVVILDQEKVSECAPGLARRIEGILRSGYGGWFQVIDVVIKERTFENWLIGDIEAIEAQPARFQVKNRMKEAVQKGLADRVDALTEIKQAAVRYDYAKIADARRIAQRANPYKIAIASRSFRRLLRVHGEPRYLNQSHDPETTAVQNETKKET